MVKYVNHIRTENSITIIFDNNEVKTVYSTDEMFNRVITLIKNCRFEDVYSEITKTIVKDNTKQKTTFKIVGNTVYDRHGNVVPECIKNRILHFKEVGLSLKPLEEFWKKALSNPSTDSRNDLYRFIEENHITLLENGNFVGYKAVTREYKDKRTRKFDNRLGQVVKMKRKNVDPDRNRSCSAGLHVAAYKYADGFKCGDDRLIEVEVNPRHVVSVPIDYGGQKIRCCEYKVVADCTKEIEEDIKNYTKDGIFVDVSLDGRINIPKKSLSVAGFVDEKEKYIDVISINGSSKSVIIQKQNNGVKLDNVLRTYVMTYKNALKVSASMCFPKNKPSRVKIVARKGFVQIIPMEN